MRNKIEQKRVPDNIVFRLTAVGEHRVMILLCVSRTRMLVCVCVCVFSYLFFREYRRNEFRFWHV